MLIYLFVWIQRKPFFFHQIDRCLVLFFLFIHFLCWHIACIIIMNSKQRNSERNVNCVGLLSLCFWKGYHFSYFYNVKFDDFLFERIHVQYTVHTVFEKPSSELWARKVWVLFCGICNFGGCFCLVDVWFECVD